MVAGRCLVLLLVCYWVAVVAALVVVFTAGTPWEVNAWRIPFLMGSVLGFVGLYLRLRMPETPLFCRIKNKK